VRFGDIISIYPVEKSISVLAAIAAAVDFAGSAFRSPQNPQHCLPPE
jgi:hypothetical protein